nr:MAG TPA: hypothetical protein [Caudoviricetes sp.]
MISQKDKNNWWGSFLTFIFFLFLRSVYKTVPNTPLVNFYNKTRRFLIYE